MPEYSREQHTSPHHDQEAREREDAGDEVPAPSTEAEEQPAESTETEPSAETQPPVAHVDFTAWHGKTLIDRDGGTIGKLEDVYFDIETEQAQFGTVKAGGWLVKRRLMFVPLNDVTIGPDNLRVSVSRAQVKDAPHIELEGDELSQAEESTLYHHYQLNYTPSAAPSGRRLARR
jgi:sporulation protein YlmC with PRC-barrel domain